MKNWKTATALVLTAAGLIHAHLSAGSLLPKGGETLKVGDSFTITWGVKEAHKSGIDIAYSINNGTNWKNIKTGFQDDKAETDTFKWTVPVEAASNQAKIRICQAAPCTDDPKHATSNPDGAAPWRLVSGTFTITAPTSVVTPASARELSIDFNPGTHNVDASFSLVRSENVSLDAFDMQGNKVASLLQGRFEAGEHKLSVFSNGISSAGTVVFKLRAGDQVRTHTWMSLR